jgi:iron complex transport system ATP-binding protein
VSVDAGQPVLALRDISLVRDDTIILDSITWEVGPEDRWVVLGRNGSGKTSLIQIAALYLHPSSGRVEVLGETLGRTDVRSLRTRIGFASASLASQLRPALTARDVVMTARYAALEPWWHRYSEADRTRAQALLDRLGVGHLADRVLGTLSSGEQQRVLLARTLMNDPGLVLLDEPTAGLDLTGREELVGALATLAADGDAPPIVLVTHHVDEIPPGFTHALLLAEGRVLAQGRLSETITAEHLSRCFGLDLRVEQRGGRFSAWAS